MQSQIAFMDFLALTPDLSLTDSVVLFTLSELSRKTRKVSVSAVARLCKISRQAVHSVLRRHRGAAVQWMGELGSANSYRVELGRVCRDSPVNAVDRFNVNVDDTPPVNAVDRSAPGEVPSSPRGGFKDLSLKGVKRNVRGLSGDTRALSSHSSKSEKPTAETLGQIQELVRYHRELCGFKTSNPLGIPAGDLCSKVAASLGIFGQEACLDLILAHVTRESKKKMTEKNAEKIVNPFLGLEWAFKPVKENGKTVPGTLDIYHCEQLIAQGRALREARERARAQESQEQEQARKQAPKSSPEVASRGLAAVREALRRGRSYVAMG